MKVIAACAVGIILMTAAFWRRADSEDDFRQFYHAASLAAAHQSVYASPYLLPYKTSADTAGVYLPFARIPSYAGTLRPLAALPYATARRLWVIAQILAALGCIWLFPRGRDRLAIALAFSAPVAYTLSLGQDIFFVLLIALAAARLDSSGHRFTAGLTASLLAIKVSFLPAVGLVFLARSRRGTFGLAIGAALQLALSFAVQGNWTTEYLALLRNPQFAFDPRLMPSLIGVVTSLGLPTFVFTLGAIGLYAWLWFAGRRLNFTEALMIALPVGMIASPHCFIYDAVVLVPLLVTTVSFDSWDGMLALAALTPIPYLLLTTGNPPLLLAGSVTIVAASIAAVVKLTTAPATGLLVLSY